MANGVPSSVPGVLSLRNPQREYLVVGTGEIISKRQYDKLRTNPQISAGNITNYKGRGKAAGLATNESRAAARKAAGIPNPKSLYSKTLNAVFQRNRDKFANKNIVRQSDMFKELWNITRDVDKGKLKGKRAWKEIRDYIDDYPEYDFTDVYWG